MSQEVLLSENEYKKLSVKFRKIASRFLNSDFEDARDNLDRFLIFIEECPTIKNFIEENNVSEYDFNDFFEKKEFNETIKLPIRASEEIAFIYQLLNYISQNNISYRGVFMGYGRKFQEACDNFHNQVVKPLVDHIVTYLGEMAIDMGLDQKSGTQFNITGFKGQINHAEGQASITANQVYNEADVQAVKDIAQEYAQALFADASIPDSDKEDAVELLEAAVQELESEKPKKAIVKMAMEKIRNINEIAATGSAVVTFGGQVLQAFQGIIG